MNDTKTICRTTEELRAALHAGLTADQIDIQYLSEENARAVGFLEGQREACDAAVRAERARIIAIQAMVKPPHEAYAQQAQEAIDSGLSPGALAMAILECESARLDPNKHPAALSLQVN